jgi:hypothetical protein
MRASRVADSLVVLKQPGISTLNEKEKSLVWHWASTGFAHSSGMSQSMLETLLICLQKDAHAHVCGFQNLESCALLRLMLQYREWLVPAVCAGPSQGMSTILSFPDSIGGGCIFSALSSEEHMGPVRAANAHVTLSTLKTDGLGFVEMLLQGNAMNGRYRVTSCSFNPGGPGFFTLRLDETGLEMLHCAASAAAFLRGIEGAAGDVNSAIVSGLRRPNSRFFQLKAYNTKTGTSGAICNENRFLIFSALDQASRYQTDLGNDVQPAVKVLCGEDVEKMLSERETIILLTSMTDGRSGIGHTLDAKRWEKMRCAGARQ